MKTPKGFVPDDAPDGFEPDESENSLALFEEDRSLSIPAFQREEASKNEHISISEPLFFPGLAAKRQEKVVRYVRACYETELTARRSAHELAQVGDHLVRAEYISWIQHIQAAVTAKSSILTIQAQTSLTIQQNQVASLLVQEAAKRGMDLLTYTQSVLESEKSRIKVEEDAGLKKNEREHKVEMDALARQDEAERARTRISVVTTASMADLQQEQQVLDALDKAWVKRHEIENGGDNPTLKFQRLQGLDEHIESLQERLRGFRKSNRQANSGE